MCYFAHQLIFKLGIASAVAVEVSSLKKNTRLVVEKSQLLFIAPVSTPDPSPDYRCSDSNLARR